MGQPCSVGMAQWPQLKPINFLTHMADLALEPRDNNGWYVYIPELCDTKTAVTGVERA